MTSILQDWINRAVFIAYADGTWVLKRPGEPAPPTAQAYTAVPVSVEAYRVQALSQAAPGWEGPQGVETFQARSAEWMEHVFAGDPTDLIERVARFGEEALELQQAFGQSREGSQALLDRVYERPPGAPHLEMGGVLKTLALLAVHTGLDMMTAGELELARCWTPEVIARVRRKRSKRHGRGVLPGDDADLVPGSVSAQTPNPCPDAVAQVRATERWVTQREIAAGQGFTGDACDRCHAFAMLRSGTCLTCQVCGTTTGCS